jgi:hypothetical protein
LAAKSSVVRRPVFSGCGPLALENSFGGLAGRKYKKYRNCEYTIVFGRHRVRRLTEREIAEFKAHFEVWLK